ncbi:ROK family protein [candidate division KSB1 bacterium]|nr:ROK family protein [candidate division KSB1 bacterium]
MPDYIGVDIGGTKTAVILGNDHGQTLQRHQFPTETHSGPKPCIEKIIKSVQNFTQNTKIKAIGISCGGPLDSLAGIIQSPPNLPGWDEISIVKILQEYFACPVYLMNDANAGALAEWQFGAGQNTQNMIFLTFGTGLGAGLILNRQLYGGTNDLAGEVGHIRITATGPEGYRKAGSFEGFCSGPGLVRLAQRRFPLAPKSSEALRKMTGAHSPITAKMITDLALAGDPFCVSVVDECGHYFGRGLAILIDLFNPECIVVGSMGVRLGELLFRPARKEIEQEALSQSARTCRLVSAQLGERIGDVAALCVAFQ